MQPKLTVKQLKQLNASAVKGVVWIICKDCGYATECKKGEASYELMSEIPICGICWSGRLPLSVHREIQGKNYEEQIEIIRPHLLALRSAELSRILPEHRVNS